LTQKTQAKYYDTTVVVVLLYSTTGIQQKIKIIHGNISYMDFSEEDESNYAISNIEHQFNEKKFTFSYSNY